MAFIFIMSEMNATQSASLSGGITEQVVKITIPKYDNLPKHQQQAVLGDVENIIRKLAHGAEYAVLGVFCMLFLLTYNWQRRKQILLAISVCALYAVSDELHQMLSDGRSAQLTDVLIDTAGASVGAMAVFWGIMIKGKKN